VRKHALRFTRGSDERDIIMDLRGGKRRETGSLVFSPILVPGITHHWGGIALRHAMRYGAVEFLYKRESARRNQNQKETKKTTQRSRA
jgi:hypothetical protein